MLNKEKIELLRWLLNQPDRVSMNTMKTLSAPQFTSTRIEELRNDGYITRSIETENGDIVGVYCISDKGRAALQEEDNNSREKRVEWIRYIITTVIAVAALVTSVVSIAMQLY